MECTDRARDFVHQHVAEFSDRHWKKLNQVNPEKALGDTIAESGNPDLVEAAANLDAIEEELNALQEKMDKAVEKFSDEFGDVLHDLMQDAETKRETFLKEQQERFEYKIKTAIGLVELVGPGDAYQVLQDCRNQINELGQ